MGSRRIVRLLLVAAVLGGLATVLAGPIVVPSVASTAEAATPTATPGVAGDTRSAGEGPGLVGAPLMAIVAVLALGGIAALLTTAYVRLTGDRAGRRGGPPDGLP